MLPYAPITINQICIWIALSLVFFGSAVWFPLVGIFLSLLTPLPSSLSLYAWGTPVGYIVPIGAFLTGILVFGISGFGASVPYFCLFIILGTLIGHFIRLEKSREFTAMAATVSVFILGTALFFWRHQGSDGPVFRHLEEKTFQYILTFLKDAGVEGIDKPYLQDQIRQTIHTVVRLLPGASFGSLLFSAAINVIGVERYSTKKGYPFPDQKRITQWSAPEWLVWPVICTGFMIFITPSWRIPAMNILIVLSVVYFLQGVCILGFFAEKWKLSMWIKAIGIFLIIVQQYLTLLVAVTGFFDTWINFRKVNKNNKKKEKGEEG